MLYYILNLNMHGFIAVGSLLYPPHVLHMMRQVVGTVTVAGPKCPNPTAADTNTLVDKKNQYCFRGDSTSIPQDSQTYQQTL